MRMQARVLRSWVLLYVLLHLSVGNQYQLQPSRKQ